MCGRPGGVGAYSDTITIQVCGAQWGSDFRAPDLQWGIRFKGCSVFSLVSDTEG